MGEVELEERTLRRELNSSLSKLQRGPSHQHGNVGGRKNRRVVGKESLNLGLTEGNKGIGRGNKSLKGSRP